MATVKNVRAYEISVNLSVLYINAGININRLNPIENNAVISTSFMT